MREVTLSSITIETLDDLPIIVKRVRRRRAVLVPYPTTAEEVQEIADQLTELVREQAVKPE